MQKTNDNLILFILVILLSIGLIIGGTMYLTKQETVIEHRLFDEQGRPLPEPGPSPDYFKENK